MIPNFLVNVIEKLGNVNQTQQQQQQREHHLPLQAITLKSGGFNSRNNTTKEPSSSSSSSPDLASVIKNAYLFLNSQSNEQLFDDEDDQPGVVPSLLTASNINSNNNRIMASNYLPSTPPRLQYLMPAQGVYSQSGGVDSAAMYDDGTLLAPALASSSPIFIDTAETAARATMATAASMLVTSDPSSSVFISYDDQHLLSGGGYVPSTQQPPSSTPFAVHQSTADTPLSSIFSSFSFDIYQSGSSFASSSVYDDDFDPITRSHNIKHEQDLTMASAASSLARNKIISDASTKHWESEATYAIIVFIFPILLTVGTIGNLITYLVLHRKTFTDKTAASWLFKCLAVMCTICLWVGLPRHWLRAVFGYDIRQLHFLFCQFHRFTLYCAMDITTWIIVSISGDRLVAVLLPFRAHQISTARNAKKIFIGLCIFFAIFNAHIFFTYSRRYATKKVSDMMTATTPTTPLPLVTSPGTISVLTSSTTTAQPPHLLLHDTSDNSSTAPAMVTVIVSECQEREIAEILFYNRIIHPWMSFAMYVIGPFCFMLASSITIARKLATRRAFLKRATSARGHSALVTLVAANRVATTTILRKDTVPDARQLGAAISRAATNNASATQRSTTVLMFVASLEFLLTATPAFFLDIAEKPLKQSGVFSTPQGMARFQLLYTIVRLLLFSNFALHFFLFCLSAHRFRREVIRVVCFWRSRADSVVVLFQRQVDQKHQLSAKQMLTGGSSPLLMKDGTAQPGGAVLTPVGGPDSLSSTKMMMAVPISNSSDLSPATAKMTGAVWRIMSRLRGRPVSSSQISSSFLDDEDNEMLDNDSTGGRVIVSYRLATEETTVATSDDKSSRLAITLTRCDGERDCLLAPTSGNSGGSGAGVGYNSNTSCELLTTPVTVSTTGQTTEATTAELLPATNSSYGDLVLITNENNTTPSTSSSSDDVVDGCGKNNNNNNNGRSRRRIGTTDSPTDNNNNNNDNNEQTPADVATSATTSAAPLILLPLKRHSSSADSTNSASIACYSNNYNNGNNSTDADVESDGGPPFALPPRRFLHLPLPTTSAGFYNNNSRTSHHRQQPFLSVKPKNYQHQHNHHGKMIKSATLSPPSRSTTTMTDYSFMMAGDHEVGFYRPMGDIHEAPSPLSFSNNKVAPLLVAMPPNNNNVVIGAGGGGGGRIDRSNSIASCYTNNTLSELDDDELRAELFRGANLFSGDSGMINNSSSKKESITTVTSAVTLGKHEPLLVTVINSHSSGQSSPADGGYTTGAVDNSNASNRQLAQHDNNHNNNLHQLQQPQRLLTSSTMTGCSEMMAVVTPSQSQSSTFALRNRQTSFKMAAFPPLASLESDFFRVQSRNGSISSSMSHNQLVQQQYTRLDTSASFVHSNSGLNNNGNNSNGMLNRCPPKRPSSVVFVYLTNPMLV